MASSVRGGAFAKAGDEQPIECKRSEKIPSNSGAMRVEEEGGEGGVGGEGGGGRWDKVGWDGGSGETVLKVGRVMPAADRSSLAKGRP